MIKASDHYAITPIDRTDLDRLLSADRACHPVPWSAADLLGEFSADYSLLFSATPAGSTEPVAYVLCRLVVDELHINRVGTLPAFRRRGLAERLLRHAFSEARSRGAAKVLLEVDSSNLEAAALYRKLGFITDTIRKHYYSSGGDALLMSRRL